MSFIFQTGKFNISMALLQPVYQPFGFIYIDHIIGGSMKGPYRHMPDPANLGAVVTTTT